MHVYFILVSNLAFGAIIAAVLFCLAVSTASFTMRGSVCVPCHTKPRCVSKHSRKSSHFSQSAPTFSYFYRCGGCYFHRRSGS